MSKYAIKWISLFKEFLYHFPTDYVTVIVTVLISLRSCHKDDLYLYQYIVINTILVTYVHCLI